MIKVFIEMGIFLQNRFFTLTLLLSRRILTLSGRSSQKTWTNRIDAAVRSLPVKLLLF